MAQLINEAKRMQFLAGLITESQLNEEEVKSVDQALDSSKVQAASEKLAQDPALLQKAMGELAKLGIDKNTLIKAAQTHKAGQSVDNIIEPKIDNATAKLQEADFSHPNLSPEDLKAAGKGGAKFGGALGAIVGFLGGAIVGPTAAVALPLGLIVAAVLGAIGVVQGSNSAKMDIYNDAVRTQRKKDQAKKDEERDKWLDSYKWDGKNYVKK